MESLSEIPQPQDSSSSEAPKLQVDFSWKKYKAFIAEHDKPSEPVYIVNFQTLKKPHIIFKSAADDTTIGSGSLHAFSINADFEIQGRKGELKAFKRWKTEYTHLSQAYSDDGTPVTMTWASASSWSTWDFICLDEQQNPVARFSANIWAVKKVGNIEFLGPKATSLAVRDEIVVTGLTLFYCMILRTSSILSFFGAIFARPGPQNDKNKGDAVESQESEWADKSGKEK